MAKYTKKPIEIEAIQWTGLNLEEIKSFVGESLQYEIIDTAWQVGKGAPRVHMVIKTLEGDHICTEGDFIIKGVNGEFYPCKPDIFEKTYQSHAADVVEVIRCKDCKYFIPDAELDHNEYPNIIEADGLCDSSLKFTDAYDFCSHGERKE